MADFQKIVQQTLLHEGGYCNDTHDQGGETYKGISRKYYPDWVGWSFIDHQKILRNFPGNLETVVNLERWVLDFYHAGFWEPIQGATIKEETVAASIFDFAVNAGVSTALLLASISAGMPATKIADTVLINALNEQEPKQFLTTYCLAKIIRYQHITAKSPDNRRFFYGWVQRALSFS
jgi:lysozyme family protein